MQNESLLYLIVLTCWNLLSIFLCEEGIVSRPTAFEIWIMLPSGSSVSYSLAVVDVSRGMAESAIVTVHSLGGDVLLESVKVSSIEELEAMSASKLNAQKCCMVSADGNMIARFLELQKQDQVTAVAQNVSPLLQLVGLQNTQGELVDETVPVEKLEQIALEIATALAHIACWFGGPHHLAGFPRVPWQWVDVLPAPDFVQNGAYLTMDHSTPVVHVGARVLFFIKDGSPCFPAVQEIRATRNLTVEDMIKIRSAHQDACNAMKSKLLALHPGADSIDAVMRLVRYTKEEVSFELWHRAYKLVEDLWSRRSVCLHPFTSLHISHLSILSLRFTLL